MSKTIELLEKLAKDSALVSNEKKSAVILASELNESQKSALLTNDVDALSQLEVDLPEITCFGIVPAEDDEPSKEDDDKEKSDTTSSSLQKLYVANL